MKYLWLLAWMVLSTPVFSAVCEVRSGEIMIVGKGFNVKPEGPSDQCSGTLEINSPEAELCLFNSLKQWSCKLYKEGDTVDVESLNIDDEYSKSFVDVLLSLWTPEEERKYGGKRLKDSEYLAGFPYGEILLPEDVLALDTSKSIERNIDSFYLFAGGQDGQLIFSSDSAVATVPIPASRLTAGQRYRWQMRAGGRQYAGTFSVAMSEDQQDFETDLRNAQSNGELAGVAGAVLRAVVAKEWGYTFDSQRALDTARESMNLD